MMSPDDLEYDMRVQRVRDLAEKNGFRLRVSGEKFSLDNSVDGRRIGNPGSMGDLATVEDFLRQMDG